MTAALALIALAHGKDLLAVCTLWAGEQTQATLPDSSLWLLASGACAAGLVSMIPRNVPVKLAAGIGTAVIVLLLAALSTSLLWTAPVLFVVVIAWQAAAPLLGKERRRDLISGALLCLVLSVAAHERYKYLMATLPREIDPDTISYIDCAKKGFLFATYHREPLYVWVVQLMKGLGGDYTPPAMRLLGFGISLGMIAGVYAFTRKWIGIWAAVISGLLLSWSQYFAYGAVRGLREDFITLVFLVFAIPYLKLWGKPITWRGYVVLGLAAGLNTLLRLNALFFILGAILVLHAWNTWKTRPPLRTHALIAVPIATAFLAAAPYMIHCNKQFGHPFFMINIQVRFYANYEFAGKRPDFPTKEEFDKDIAAGGPISMGQYLFKYHSVPEVITGSTQGMWRLYAGSLAKHAMAFGDWTRLLFALHLAGLAVMLLPGRNVIALLNFMFHAPMFFLMSFEWFDPRLAALAFAMFYVGTGAAVQSAWDFSQHYLSRQNLKPEPVRTRGKPKQRSRTRLK